MISLLRKEEIKSEIHRRLDLWLEHSSFKNMSNGSFLRFEMSIALGGYPFQPEPWMDAEKDFYKFLTEKEFQNNVDSDLLFEAYQQMCEIEYGYAPEMKPKLSVVESKVGFKDLPK